MDYEKNKLSVIMPALNEEANICDAISNTLKAFDLFGINGEIIVVDDGSADRTRSLAEEKSKKYPSRVHVINHDRPKGIGSSFWKGVDSAKGDAIVMLPGDNENDPQEAFRYYKLLEQVDIVIPFIFNREARPIFRNVLSLLYRFIINSTFMVNFRYTNGTVLYRRSILWGIDERSDGFFFQTDILIRAAKKGYLFAEVPYKVGSRKNGSSKAINFPSLFKVIKGYLKLVRDYYFSKNKKRQQDYSSDSQTAARRK
ncbi:MAG: glycosyltransferase family 2 protein [Candidatus Omnitrophica bacterium]|nr:glycosyltransferase family 2 protein [Candidatus Omnitrophota bacterium]MDD5310184.1 glycosyltransferase family 2 protein [Candidatus Omnitrophota bacterium]MDD5546239.1 glycosyltransferase family 2 protein [Candidatus Omnitrophota bacterium]